VIFLTKDVEKEDSHPKCTENRLPAVEDIHRTMYKQLKMT